MFSKLRKIFTEYRQLRYLAYHDPLTGLLNRNWLYENINRINCKYVYFIDINDLHKINKQGHTFGDKYINMCVDMINVVLKNTKKNSNNCLVRYAGDEFILFSNQKDVIKSNQFFSVGTTRNDGDLNTAINIADMNMMKMKKK